MSPVAWKWTKVALIGLAAAALGVLLGQALVNQFLFFPVQPTGPARQVIAVLASLVCLVPLLLVLVSALLSKRLGWRLTALAFLLPIFAAFAYVTVA